MSCSHPDVPFLPADDPGTTEEEFIPTVTEPQIRLFTKHWVPSTVAQGRPPVAALLLVHGFCENLYRYEHVLPSFADKGIYVTAYDQRGYGVTAEKGMPGKWPKETYSNTSLTLLLDDLNQMILGERQRMDNKYGPGVVPFFLMGHSMGGQLALSAVTRPANSPHLPPSTVEGLAGVIGSAPWLKLSMPPPKPVLEFGKFLLKLFPDHPWINPVTPKKLCKDKVVLADLRKSPYTRRRIYLRAGEEPTLNGLDVLNDKYTNFPPHLPLLIIHGERDPVVSPSGSVAFDKKVKADDKTLIFYKGHLHEPLQERLEERTKVANTIISWIVQHAEQHKGHAAE